MTDIFMCLLMNFKNHGKITVANMYDSGFVKMTLVGDDNEYDISVLRREKTEEEKND